MELSAILVANITWQSEWKLTDETDHSWNYVGKGSPEQSKVFHVFRHFRGSTVRLKSQSQNAFEGKDDSRPNVL